MSEGIIWFFKNIGQAFPNLFYAITHPKEWLAWVPRIGGDFKSDDAEHALAIKQSLARFVYYGASVELFFIVLTSFLILTAFGIWKRDVMWGVVRGLEGFANFVGRFFAWAGLLMVLQQIMIIFLQRIFLVAKIEFKVFGHVLIGHDLSWWSEELKLYNAIVVCLCVSYTFVQGGHVRVDLVYSAVRYRTRKVIDMMGALFFMMPMAVLMWLFAWFFMWRHIVVPNPNATKTLDQLLTQSRALRWNLETIGFSPNGFDKYYMFKILMVVLAALIFLQAVAFFYRSFLNFVEGEESEGKYLDKDFLGEEKEAYDGTH